MVLPPGLVLCTLTVAWMSWEPPPLRSVVWALVDHLSRVTARLLAVCSGSSFQGSWPCLTIAWSFSAWKRVRSGKMPGKLVCTKVFVLGDHLNSRKRSCTNDTLGRLLLMLEAPSTSPVMIVLYA